MVNFSCNIKAIGITPSELDNPSYSETIKALLNNIPMMQARRLSYPSKLACALFCEFIKESHIDYAIFLSAHGEIERSYKVLNQIFTTEEASPTDFSMSVHNAAAGISGILTKSTCEVSSISGGKEGFINCLYEISARLQSEDKAILLIAFDGKIPDFYHHFKAPREEPYAVGILFERGMENRIAITATEAQNTPHSFQEKDRVPLALQFWELWQSQSQFTLIGENRQVQLLKNGNDAIF